jgi:hypothetical protein
MPTITTTKVYDIVCPLISQATQSAWLYYTVEPTYRKKHSSLERNDYSRDSASELKAHVGKYKDNIAMFDSLGKADMDTVKQVPSLYRSI